MLGQVFAHAYKIVQGNAACQTALSAADYPASGSYVNITGADRVHVVISLGGIADAVTFKLQKVSAVNGTPAQISTDVEKTIANTDDGQVIVFTVDTKSLGDGYNYLTVDVSDISGSNYASIVYYLEGLDQPVTQSTAVPSDNILTYTVV